jgi:hypothetical protein
MYVCACVHSNDFNDDEDDDDDATIFIPTPASSFRVHVGFLTSIAYLFFAFLRWYIVLVGSVEHTRLCPL